MRPNVPQNELYEQLQSIGWSLQNISMKNGLFVAKGIGPAEQEADRVGQSPEGALAALLLYAQRSNALRRFAAVKKYASWSTNFLDQVAEIAQAYSKAPVFDEKAVPAWRALAAESKMQADAIRQQIKVDVTDNPEPYRTSEEMCKDVHQNKHFTVSRANSQHPVWSTEDNVNFRIVHDVLGHCQSGGDFGWVGENLACGAHFPLISPLAREALFTECIGQNAYKRQTRGFGPQKVCLLSEFLHPAQEKEGEHVFVPHGGVPSLMQAPNQNASAEIQPQEKPPKIGPGFSPAMQGIHGDGSTSVMRPMVMSKLVSDAVEQDPNEGWESPQTTPAVTAGDPNDYLGVSDVVANAAKIDTEWWEKDDATQKKAIMNAFRVAILSPRKHLKWNAAHYQGLMNADPETSARDMWDMLENEREKHNQKLGYPEGSHLTYQKSLHFLADQLAQQDNLSPQEALAKAKDLIFAKIKEFEQQIGRQAGDETSELRRYNQARVMVADWMAQNYSPGRGWMPGQQMLTKTADYNGWTNWDTWNVKLMMDNEQPLYQQSRQIVQDGINMSWPDQAIAERLEEWAIRKIIGPANRQAIIDAQEWNDIPPEERIDYNYEDLKNKSPQAADIVNQLGFGADVGDTDPMTMDIDLINWDEIVASIKEDLEEERRYEAGEPPSWQEQPQQNLDQQPGDLTFPENWTSHVKVADDWHPQLFNTPQQQVPDATGFGSEEAKYGAFMGTHLDALEAVGKHIDEIRDAALADIETGGKGFTFRRDVMNMNLAGVNPKVCSFAWLLLRPMSSDLGIIDTHMLRGLGRNEKDMSVRDYYKLERMQRAAKDASGYSHLPQGLYHWGFWDHIRNPGQHSDHSPLRVLDPEPWDTHSWDAASSARSGPFVGHPAFEAARPYMEQAAQDFDQEYGQQPANMVPTHHAISQPEQPRLVSPFVIPYQGPR